jgi:hypothetical protein
MPTRGLKFSTCSCLSRAALTRALLGSSAAFIGTVGTTALTVTQQTMNAAVSNYWNTLNSQFESDTGYASIADAVNDLKTMATGGSSTAAFDTDLRTRFTNAMQAGSAAGTINTINDALGKLSTYSGLITTNTQNFADLINNFKLSPALALTNRPQLPSEARFQSYLTSALATFRTTLTTEFVQDMNEVTGGTGTTFAQAISDVVSRRLPRTVRARLHRSIPTFATSSSARRTKLRLRSRPSVRPSPS